MAEVKVIRKEQCQTEVASGAMTRVAGVSEALAGAKGIHLAVATIPPGQRSSAHWHTNCESAIYILRGKGRFLVGETLERELAFAAGAFIDGPGEAPHQPVNEGAEPVEMVVARNTPVELVREYAALPLRPSAGD